MQNMLTELLHVASTPVATRSTWWKFLTHVQWIQWCILHLSESVRNESRRVIKSRQTVTDILTTQNWKGHESTIAYTWEPSAIVVNNFAGKKKKKCKVFESCLRISWIIDYCSGSRKLMLFRSRWRSNKDGILRDTKRDRQIIPFFHYKILIK